MKPVTAGVIRLSRFVVFIIFDFLSIHSDVAHAAYAEHYAE